MTFTDISSESTSVYRLTQGGLHVFFLLNRSGDITFELLEPGAEAVIFALFTGKQDTRYSLNLNQKHLAPSTTSRAVVKSILTDQSTVDYWGTIHIAPVALQSTASQESRSLLLSPQARTTTAPNLEILTDDVQCYHAATVSAVDPEKLFFLGSRGLDKTAATRLIVSGFVNEIFEHPALDKASVSTLRQQILTHFAELYA